MKAKKLSTLLAIPIAITMGMSVTKAYCDEYKFAKNWTAKDTTYQVTANALIAMDWMQTIYIAKRPNEYYETNPILGKHPSRQQVNTYFAICSIAHPLISLALPDKKEVFGYQIPIRRIWQGTWIAIEGGYVIHNMSIGVQFSF